MSITLKVKNTSDKPITVGDGSAGVEIAAGKEADVPLAVVGAPMFAEHVANGRLAIGPKALDGLAPSARATATQAIGDLVLRVAPRFLAHHQQLVSATGNLAAMRDRYNEQHAATVKLLEAAKGLKAGVEATLQATQLLTAVEEGAVAAADGALAKHLDEVPKKDELPAWYAKHKQLEADRDAAVRMREAAKGALAKQLDAMRAELGAAAAAFGKVDAKKDVGSPIAWGS